MAERLPPSQIATPLPGAGMPVGEDLIEEDVEVDVGGFMVVFDQSSADKL